MRLTRVLLVVVAVVCFGVALSYPIRYWLAQNENNSNMEELSAMRARVQEETTADDADTDQPGVPESEDAVGADEAPAPGVPVRPTVPPEDRAGDDGGAQPAEAAGDQTSSGEPEAGEDGPMSADAPTESDVSSEGNVPDEEGEPGEVSAPVEGNVPAEGNVPVEGNVPSVDDAPVEDAAPQLTPEPTPEPTPVANPDLELLLLDGVEPTPEPTISVTPKTEGGSLVMAETPEPSATPVWDEYTGPLPYPMLEKVAFDPKAILPELREIYALNNDLVGWINIPGTVIDYPVVQCQDSDFYLEHDFYKNENINGQIILDTLCDPYTPSYNLIISGHHMKNGSMFGDLPEYRTQAYWEKHKLIEFDSLMFRKQYVVFAAFYSADYDEDEEGFRYNANIQYNMEAKQWLREIKENELYDTGIDVQFGDEFITLTTCNRARHKNGRFVVVARKIREGETFE